MGFYGQRRTIKEMMAGIENVLEHKKIANNTMQYKTTEYEAIRIHLTDVVKVFKFKNGNFKKIILDSGGWRIPTTKERINDFLCANDCGFIGQDKSVWYLHKSGKQYAFQDGMDAMHPKSSNKEEARVKKLKKLISTYIKAIKEAQESIIPSNGDCWDCLMRDKDGNTMGEVSKSDHLMSHLEEKYVHGSIIVNAMRDAGFKDKEIKYHFHFWSNMKGRVADHVRKYFYKQMAIEYC